MKKTFKTNGRLLYQVFSSYKTTFDALCELINNSIQAKVTKIDIEVDSVDDEEVNPFPFTEYRIIDNGEGVSSSEFEQKILQIATDSKGSKGIGRFAAFQIGATVLIETTAYDPQIKKYTNTTVELNAQSLSTKDLNECAVEVRSDRLKEKRIDTFYKVTINNFWNEEETEKYPNKKLIQKLIPGKLLEESLFLKYSSYIVTDKIMFIINGNRLSRDNFLVGEVEKDSFKYTFSDGSIHSVLLEYVNCRGKNKKIILSYRMDNNGIKVSGYEEFMILEYPDNNSWIVYIDCDYFNSKTDIFRNLYLDGTDKELADIKNQIKSKVRNFIKEKHKEYFVFEEKLVNDKYYPYKDNIVSPSKIFTFNQLAYFIEKDYLILNNDDTTRKIIYPLLDRAMNNGDIEGILLNIISLDDDKVKTFRELLEKTDLSDIIRFTTDIVNKQRLLDFLNKIIYGDIAKYIYERKQLHKIIEKHLWLFGEEYSATPIINSDTSLKNNLEKLRNDHLQYRKSEEDKNFIDFSESEIMDITDLFFYNRKPLGNDRHEVMIVELKAPKVKISQKELNQINRYKFDIENLGKFSKLDTRYKIILISSDFTPIAQSQIGTVDKNRPTLYAVSNNNAYDIEVHVMKWSDIIARNKKHLTYLGNYLETKDVDVINMFKDEYPKLDIKTLVTHTQKIKNRNSSQRYY
jgi:hypothetical protein